MNKESEKEKLEALLKIKKRKDILSFKRSEFFEDDHCQCCNVTINGVEVPFWWYGSLGFLEYWQDSKTAFRDFLEELKLQVESRLEELGD